MQPVPWGVSSETGRLRDVLLCRPEHYAWAPINAVARASLARGLKPDRQAAKAQYGEFLAALEQAHVARHFVETDPALGYQVYTRDISLVAPEGAIILQPFRVIRNGEVAHTVEFHERAGIPRRGWITAGCVEGGDIHLIRPGLAVIGCSGERTTERGAAQLAAMLEAMGYEVRIQPFAEHFLHLDVIFCMASEGIAVACTEVIEPDFADWLGGHGIELVPVGYRDSMALGCNLLSLGNGTVISPEANRELNARLRAAGLTVLDPDLSVFTAGGGGAHCMTMPLRRDPIA
jgi:N-dimethylarginine dimethylaminohydrolase